MTTLPTTLVEPNSTTCLSLINLSELIKVVPLSRTGIYERLNPKSKYYDPTFPKPIKLGKRSNRWLKEEVVAWVEALKTSRSLLRNGGVK